MRLKKTGGKLVHEPLSFSFSMLELGGSNVQKYNAITGAYVPDRSLTPYMLKPQLIIEDPEGNIVTGDYATSMRNVVWTLKVADGKNVVTPTNFSVDDSHAITIRENIPTGKLLSIDFRGEYYNATRNETTRFEWHKNCVTEEERPAVISLELRCPSKMNFSPFKKYGDNQQFPIQAVLRNGEADIDLKECTFKWQYFDFEEKQWKDIVDDDCLWYVSGKNSGTITVNVDYIQKVCLKVEGYPTAYPSEKESASTLLRRWYGQWDDKYMFAYAQFIFKDTRQAKAVARITRGGLRGGDITNPQKYFDIEMFYRENATADWKSLGNGTEFIIQREQMTGEHQLGGITRELSAYMPIILPDGKVLMDTEGKPVVARFPTSEQEFE